MGKEAGNCTQKLEINHLEYYIFDQVVQQVIGLYTDYLSHNALVLVVFLILLAGYWLLRHLDNPTGLSRSWSSVMGFI